MENTYTKIITRSTLIFLIVFSSFVSYSATYYLSPNGSDSSGSGSSSSPWFTINKAWTVVKAGDIVYMKGGTYRYNSTQRLQGRSGSSGNLIKVWAVPGEKPIISPSSSYSGKRGIDIIGNYIHVKGLEITGFTQKTSTAFYYGIVAENSNHLILEQLKVHDNGFGLSIGSDSGDNLVLNSDFYRNSDPLSNFSGNIPYDGADGITIRSSNLSKTNTIRGCRMWWNSDDGVDLFKNQGTIIIENSWAFWNGFKSGSFTKAGNGNGFKIGITATDLTPYVKRILRHNLAFENRVNGFDQNDARCITHLYNNTTYNNGMMGPVARSLNFYNGTAATIAKNNLDFKYTYQPKFNPQAIVTNNTFLKDGSVNTAFSVSSSDFLSIDTKGVDGPRQSDGSLPNLNFLKLAPTSDLLNKGTNVGLPYSGSAPDLGAFEMGLSISSSSTSSSDVTKPIITSFTIPSTYGSRTVPISAFSGSDNIGVTGYLITRSSTKPTLTTTGWRSTRPTSFTFTSSGSKILFAWIRDAAGNISSARYDEVIVTASSLSVNTNEFASTTHFLSSSVENGSDSMNIDLTGLNENVLSIGDELAVFDGNICVSSLKLSADHLNTGIAQLIATSDEDNQIGFTNGHPIQIWHWNAQTGAESLIDAEVVNGKMVFEAQSKAIIQLKFLTTGITDVLQSFKIDIFPNPCTDNVTIRFSQLPEAGSRIEIIDKTGKRVESREITNSQETFDLRQHSTGLYMIKTTVDSKEVINKLIINR